METVKFIRPPYGHNSNNILNMILYHVMNSPPTPMGISSDIWKYVNFPLSFQTK